MKSERVNSRPGAPAPAQGSLHPAHMPPQVLPHSVPHHHWPRAPVPPRHSGAVGLFSPLQTAGLLQPQGGRQRSVWRRLKGRTKEESGRRPGGCTVPVPEGSTWLSPSSVTGDSWGDSSWPWGPVPPKGVEDRTGLGWLCLDGSAVTPSCLSLDLQLSRRAPKASFWMVQEPPPPQPPAITSTWLMGRDLSLDFLAGAFSVSDVYLWRGNS